jgi:hypothetical protein
MTSAAITDFKDCEIFVAHHLLENTPEESPIVPGPQLHVPLLFRASSNASVAEERGLEDPADLTIFDGL